jgi:DNA-binding PadR family transcriptional regulator
MSRDIIREEARLIILRALASEPRYTLNEALLQAQLETFGIARARPWIREELRRLEDLGAVTNTEVGSVLIATMTEKGRDHVERRIVVEGVKRPSPGG